MRKQSHLCAKLPSVTARRRALLFMAAAAVSAAACSRRSEAPDAEEPVLNLYNWYDYFGSDVLRAFEAETGIRTRYDSYDSNQTLEAKLLAGRSGYDVVFPSAATLQRLAKAQVFRPLQRELLPKYGNLDPRFLQRLEAYDAGNRLAVPYAWGVTGLGIDFERLRATAPDAPIDSWALIFDPAVAGKAAGCGIGLYESPTTIFPSALAWLGLPTGSDDAEGLRRAAEALSAARPQWRKISQGSLVEDLANGDLCVTLASDGDVRQAQERARTQGRARDLRFVSPKEGATLWFDVAAIPADAPHPGNAHRFIDYLLRGEVSAANSEAIGFPNGNAAAQASMRIDLRNDTLYPGEQRAASLFAEVDHSPDYVRERTRWWTRVRTGRP